MENLSKEVHNIYDELKYIFDTKNKNYGNSFQEVREEFKEFPVILIRLSDKFRRVKTLLMQKFNCTKMNPSDESIEDTLLDLANYCILEVACMRVDNKPQYNTIATITFKEDVHPEEEINEHI